MKAIVTLGPTQEPLDAMRLLSNRSTGELGSRLCQSLVAAGLEVTALRGIGSTWASPAGCQRILSFSTAADLSALLEKEATEGKTELIFHTAAVADFQCQGPHHGKIPSKGGSLQLTLEPTPKILPRLRKFYPTAQIIGWKFEAEGGREEAMAAARTQLLSCQTDACVLNGPAYGQGFGLITSGGLLEESPDRMSLSEMLIRRFVRS